MEEPDQQAVESPTQTEQDAEEANTWMVKHWVTIAVPSIAAVLLFVLALMQGTGTIDLVGDGFGQEVTHWIAFVALVLVTVAVFAWSRRGV